LKTQNARSESPVEFGHLFFNSENIHTFLWHGIWLTASFKVHIQKV
jgi:hypothetical protein